jgi:hypothetical protein
VSIHTKLPGVSLKVLRAKEHLETIREIDCQFASTDCEIVVKEDRDKDLGWLELQLPKPPLQISVIVGECLHNLRSALDYLVWQLVLANPPHEPTSRNMFPICSSPELFADQLKRGRLKGVSLQAQSAIEDLQPFGDAEHPLSVLDALNNMDKHRNLNFTLAVASDLDLFWTRNGEVVTRTIIGNEDVHDGARLIGYSLSHPSMQRHLELQVFGRANGFLAFKESLVTNEEPTGVVAVLDEIWEFVANEAVFALERFIDSPGSACASENAPNPTTPADQKAPLSGR